MLRLMLSQFFLLQYIVNNKPLDNKKYITKKFVNKTDWQNNGITENNAYRFIKLYNKHVEFCYYCDGIIFQKYITCLLSHGGHTTLLYKNNLGQIEKYDSSSIKHRVQYTENNCTLYAGIVGIVRPLVKDMKTMMKILKLVCDKQNTKSCERLVEISKHYFGRGKEYFKYYN